MDQKDINCTQRSTNKAEETTSQSRWADPYEVLSRQDANVNQHFAPGWWLWLAFCITILSGEHLLDADNVTGCYYLAEDTRSADPSSRRLQYGSLFIAQSEVTIAQEDERLVLLQLLSTRTTIYFNK